MSFSMAAGKLGPESEVSNVPQFQLWAQFIRHTVEQTASPDIHKLLEPSVDLVYLLFGVDISNLLRRTEDVCLPLLLICPGLWGDWTNLTRLTGNLLCSWVMPFTTGVLHRKELNEWSVILISIAKCFLETCCLSHGGHKQTAEMNR